ncbi:MAG: cell wall hydrolase [Verrucomicrobiota bacterium]
MKYLRIIGITLLALAVFMPASTQAQLSNYERQIVAATLVLEAAGEGTQGMQAVLNVIFNRANHRTHRIVGVVAKYGAFSSLNSVTKNQSPDYSPILRRAQRDQAYPTAYRLVKTLEREGLYDLTEGSDYFYSVHGERPSWASDMEFVKKIGDHRFYRSK